MMPSWVDGGVRHGPGADAKAQNDWTAERRGAQADPRPRRLTLAESFTSLLLAHRRTLVAIVRRWRRRYGIRSSEADDLLQDVLAEGWRSYLLLGPDSPRDFV